jgi:hypothetical protein
MVFGLDMRFLGGKREKLNRDEATTIESVSSRQRAFGAISVLSSMIANPMQTVDPSTPLRSGRDDKLCQTLWAWWYREPTVQPMWSFPLSPIGEML